MAAALLAAVDLHWTADGDIGSVEPDQAIYRTIFARTFGIAAGVTLITLVLSFPLAWLLANLPGPPPPFALAGCPQRAWPRWSRYRRRQW